VLRGWESNPAWKIMLKNFSGFPEYRTMSLPF